MSDAGRAQRSLWLTPRFLHDRGAVAAHARGESLGRAVHDELLRTGDRLAAISVSLAQRYYCRAPAAWCRFGGDGFARWVALGEELAGREPACREGAIAYFKVPPKAFGAGALDTAAAWCSLARRVADTSRKLATVFLETTPVALKRAGALARLEAWVGVGLSLYRQRGWQGEFLAQAYFSSAPRALLTLPPALYQLWAGAGVALQPVLKERDFFGKLPRELHEWKDAERETFLRLVLALAADSPKHAAVVYRELPAAMRPLSPTARATLLRTLLRSGKYAAALAELAPVAGAVLQQVPAPWIEAALSLVDAAAERFPDVTAAALRSLPRLYEEASPEQVREWFAAGLALDPDNALARLAYFGLESRTSLKVLSARSTAVTLEEVQGLLRKYIQMLSGEPASIRAIGEAQLCLPLEEFPAENELALPLRVALFDTHEENFRLYRFLAAQVAGRRELGTYAFVPPSTATEEHDPAGSALRRYLDDPQHPDLLEDLFLLAEGIRVHGGLCRTYAGVAADGRWVGQRLLLRAAPETRADRAQFLDTLFSLALVEWDAPTPSWLAAGVVDLVRQLIRPLTVPAATVQDSMHVAHALATRLAEATPRAIPAQLDGEALLLERIAGDALLDPYLDDAGSVPAAATAARAPAHSAGDRDSGNPLDTQLALSPDTDDGRGGSQPMSVDELKRLIEAGVDLKITQASGEEVDGLGLYITDLIGKIPSQQLDELRRLLGGGDEGPEKAPRRWLGRQEANPTFYYDEWDYHIGDYRSRWCRLEEITLEPDSGEFYNQTLVDYAWLIPEVRRQFQRVRPEMYRTVRGLEDGEDFDLNAVINALVEGRAGRPPSPKLYTARKREERDVATLFLLDMSASTDEPLDAPARPPGGDGEGWSRGTRARHATAPARRIIDLTKAALVVMGAALEEIGDAYAIYGFSGHGREHVEFYRVKSFAETLSPTVKGRMGSIEPKRSTRMGTALRHAVEKLASTNSRSKHLFLLSDGFPQDHDYGQDRRSNVYGIRDTAMALREAQSAGVTPFCITVDRAGHDYLRQMCDGSRYLVIEDVEALPHELPKIYQRIVSA
jgi:nitric oxide reductase NorD protein